MLDLYRSRQAPQPLGTVIFEEIEAKAKETLKDYGGASSSSSRTRFALSQCIQHDSGAFMYAGGSAGTSSTYRANRQAFEKYGIIPRMLVNASTRSLEVRRKTNRPSLSPY